MSLKLCFKRHGQWAWGAWGAFIPRSSTICCCCWVVATRGSVSAVEQINPCYRQPFWWIIAVHCRHHHHLQYNTGHLSSSIIALTITAIIIAQSGCQLCVISDHFGKFLPLEVTFDDEGLHLCVFCIGKLGNGGHFVSWVVFSILLGGWAGQGQEIGTKCDIIFGKPPNSIQYPPIQEPSVWVFNLPIGRLTYFTSGSEYIEGCQGRVLVTFMPIIVISINDSIIIWLCSRAQGRVLFTFMDCYHIFPHNHCHQDKEGDR